jgi:hypothetical protein
MPLIGWNWMEMDGMTISVTMFAKNGHFPSNSPFGGHFDSENLKKKKKNK